MEDEAPCWQNTKEMEKVNEDMIGNFGGIGVQFYKYRDTVTIIKVVPGGPSQDAGLQGRMCSRV